MKITLNLTSTGGNDGLFTTVLPNGETAQFCKSEMCRVFGLDPTKSYKIRFRQTKMETRTTSVILRRDGTYWKWGLSCARNFFGGDSIDRFLDANFPKNTDIFFRSVVVPL